MKKKKIFLYILIGLFILTLLAWSFPIFAQTVSPNSVGDSELTQLVESGRVSGQVLGVAEPSLLPGDFFYFLKNWSNGIRYFFSFGQIAKAKSNLVVSSQKLLELRKLIDNNLQNVPILNKGISNYKSVGDKLFGQINAFDVGSSDQKLNSFLLGSAINLFRQEEVYEEMLAQQDLSADVRSSLVGLDSGIRSEIKLVIEKFGIQEKFIQQLQQIADSAGLFQNLRTLEAIETWGSGLGVVSGELDNLKSYLYLKIQAGVYGGGQSLQDRLSEAMVLIPGDLSTRQKIFRQLEERSGQREFFSKIADKIGEAFDSPAALKQCQDNIVIIEGQLTEFKLQIVKLLSISNSIKSLVDQVDAHLKQAKVSGQTTKIVCGLVNSAQVLLNNAKRLLTDANPVKIQSQLNESQNVLKDIRQRSSSFDKDQYQRLFDLINQGQMQIEVVQNYLKLKNYDQALRELDKLTIINDNANSIINNYKNEVVLFSKKNLDDFQKWCLNQKGLVVENFSILPFCSIGEKLTSMLDWTHTIEK